MGTSGGQPCRTWPRALLLGDSEGAPKKAVRLGSHPTWGGHNYPSPGPASHPTLGAQSPFLGCLGAAVEVLSSASVWSLPCAHHILRQRSPIQKVDPGPTLGSRGQVDRRRTPNSAVGLVPFWFPAWSPSPCSGAGDREVARGSKAAWDWGLGPPLPPGGPHTSPGTQPLFLRKTELPKQINQPVKKKPWRKNLSTLPAKKLKRGIVLGDGGGDISHLSPGPLPAGASPSSRSWSTCGQRPLAATPRGEPLFGPVPALTVTPSSQKQSPAQSEEA